MSIEAYQAVWSYKGNGFTTNLRCTLLALAEFASKYNGYTCCASVATIAEMVDTKPRQAQRNLNDLEALGLIKITPNRGRGNTNLYDLNPVMALKGVIRDLKPVIHDTFSTEENTSSVTPIIQEKVSSGTQKVSSRALKGVIHDTQTVLTNNNHKKEEEYIYIAPLPEPMTKMISALSKASKTPYGAGFNETIYEQAASLLLKQGITPEQVDTFPEYWKSLGWGGSRGLPTIEKVVEEMNNCINRVDTRPIKRTDNGNGSHQPTERKLSNAEAGAVEYAAMRANLVRKP